MADTWAINHQVIDNDSLTVELGSFAAGRKPTIREGDSVILFDHRARDIRFWGSGTVTELKILKTEGPEERTPFFASIRVEARFEPIRELSELRFSLDRVYRFRQPYVHFQGKYSWLSYEDAETIRNRSIAWARTAVGLLADSLSRSDRLRLATMFVDQIREISHRELAEKVVAFVKERYVTTAMLIREIRNSASRLQLNELPLSDIVLQGPRQGVSIYRLEPSASAVVEAFIGESPNVFLRMAELDGGHARSEFRMNHSEMLRILMVEQ